MPFGKVPIWSWKWSATTPDDETKRFEYARAGIPEYWIADPAHGRITVLTLEEESYVVHMECERGERASSRLLPTLLVDVTAALSGEAD